MQAGFARKYAIMEELDGGFGAGSTPEAFVRLDSWEGRIQASLHVKGLKRGPFKYMLYLIFANRDQLTPILLGDVNISYNGMQSGLEIDAETLKSYNLKPEAVRFAALTAESQNKKWIPLFSSFEKSYKWDESIRQIILMNFKAEPKDEPINTDSTYVINTNIPPTVQNTPIQENISEAFQPKTDTSANSFYADPANTAEEKPRDLTYSNDAYSPVHKAKELNAKRTLDNDSQSRHCNLSKLEGMLSNNFEVHSPFKRASKGYSWYRVSDLAKLSNIMYMSGINVPLFANPKILVGLFKFKHILAGIYRGDNGSDYYVIGVPAKDEKDNKPFENACRWAPIQESSIRDMGGYWLVYVSLKTGEIVV